MLKLHGFAISNYFKMVHMALLEKGAEFSLENTYPSQDAAFLARSPVGKVPCLETDQGFLSESAVILDYIEEALPGPHLYPADAFERARVRQVMHMLELYVELPARRLYPGVFFGGSNAELTIKEVKPVMQKGIRGLRGLVTCEPFLLGEQFGFADIFAAFTFSLAAPVCSQVYDWDIVAEIAGLKELLLRLNARDAALLANADSKAALAAFQRHLAGKG